MAMTVCFKGVFTCGGVFSIPIRLGSVVPGNKAGLKMVRKEDGSLIKYMRVAKADWDAGKPTEVQWEDIGRGFEVPGGMVVLSDRELEDLKGDERHMGEIVTFAKSSDIPPLAIEKSYHVKPAEGGDKGYALLYAALTRAGKVGVLRFAMRDSLHLAILWPDGEGYLVLSQLYWGSDVTKPDYEAPEFTFSEREEKLADQLVEAMTDESFDFAECQNERAERLEALMMSKVESGPTHRTSDDGPRTQEQGAAAFGDMMSAIQAAVQQKREEKEVSAEAPKPRVRRKAVS